MLKKSQGEGGWLTIGASLEDAEKAHLARCPSCLADVIKALDESASGMAAPGGELPHARPGAKMALERGRRVFEREFGISATVARRGR